MCFVVDIGSGTGVDVDVVNVKTIVNVSVVVVDVTYDLIVGAVVGAVDVLDMVDVDVGSVVIVFVVFEIK